MKRKLICVLLSLTLVLSLLTACGQKTNGEGTDAPETSSAEEQTQAPETDAPTEPAVQPEAIPEAKYYYSFDGEADGAVVKEQNTGGATVAEIIYDSADREMLYTDGVKGQCVYLDSKYGFELPIEPVGESYTLSFWVYAERLNTYGAVIQFGQDLFSANVAARWLNVTTLDAGTTFPLVWTRDEATGVWPVSFSNYAGTASGLKSWAHIAIVVDENNLTEDGVCLKGQLYINGEEVVSDDLAMEVTKGVFNGTDDFHFFVGINCWDALFKGAIDELYVFDQPLTAGQVLTLYQDGDPSVAMVVPEGADVTPETTEPIIKLPSITEDENAISTIGTKTKLVDFWTEFTDGYEIKDGETKTVVLNNYTDANENWHNYLLAFATVQTTSDLAPSAENYEGYAEYAVLRADLFGWGDASYAAEFEGSWGADWWTFRNMMTAAKITMTITRSGSELTIDSVIQGGDGNEYTSRAVVTSTLTADAPCYFFFTAEKCYVELISVE